MEKGLKEKHKGGGKRVGGAGGVKAKRPKHKTEEETG